MTAVSDATPHPTTPSAEDARVPRMSPDPVAGRTSPNLATLARLRGAGRSPLLSPTARRAHRAPSRPGPRACTDLRAR